MGLNFSIAAVVVVVVVYKRPNPALIKDPSNRVFIGRHETKCNSYVQKTLPFFQRGPLYTYIGCIAQQRDSIGEKRNRRVKHERPIVPRSWGRLDFGKNDRRKC
jgi:hypothetical protein